MKKVVKPIERTYVIMKVETEWYEDQKVQLLH